MEEMRTAARLTREENEKFREKTKNHTPLKKTTPKAHATKPKGSCSSGEMKNFDEVYCTYFM